MTTYSDAAEAYARQDGNPGYYGIASAFDAGVAHALADWPDMARTTAAEPERLTDPADLRIRDGALVSVTFPRGAGPEGTTYTSLVGPAALFTREQVASHVSLGGSVVVLLLTESELDPDAEILAAVAQVFKVLDGYSDAERARILANLRAAGLDVVKVAS